MRRFIVLGHEATTSSDFTLDDLAGATGRLDVLLRCVNSAFMLSHGLRKDTELYLLLLGPPRPPRVVRFVGDELRYLNPDERSTAALVRKALALNSPGESTPGVYLEVSPLETLLSEVATNLIVLREDGEDLRRTSILDSPTFLLSDHMDYSQEEMVLLEELSPAVVSVGPLPLHAHHCITLVHNELDRRGG